LRTNNELVQDFMWIFGQRVRKELGWPGVDVAALRIELIDEELNELREATGKQDLVGIADALTDLLYVVYGAGHAYGINLDDCFAEVHRSNMSKLDEESQPIYREDGKVLKGPNYSPPDLGQIIGMP
tara:strand:+ start:488 stop:868 length:381 start_codon:yes stop_codon:yes gene_type:complete